MRAGSPHQQALQGGKHDAPHIILFPEIAFNERAFLARVQTCVKRYEYCVIVVSEGVRHTNGRFLAETNTLDAFGHAQLGGVAPALANLVRKGLGYKYHYAIADYLQRSARHIASKVDVDQAYAVGKAAVEFAVKGENAIMPTIVRHSDKPYRWSIGKVALSRVANREKMLPRRFISRDGFRITTACKRYLSPLVRGEDYPPYANGIPAYGTLKNVAVERRLRDEFVIG